MKLLGKQGAPYDPSFPSNFRPIGLTSCGPKQILRNRWLSFMTTNNHLDHSVQRLSCLMHRTPSEISFHHQICQDKAHKSLAVCLLDMPNAYGSVQHSLISFAFQKYYAPPSFFTLSTHSIHISLSATVAGPHLSCIEYRGIPRGTPYMWSYSILS